jgi:outer membrane lipoprotein SlyB
MLQYEGDEYDVRTEAVERVAAATKGEDATKIGIGAGAGAALGAILGGGSGAAKGAAIGAAAGTGAVLATHGEEVRLDPGEAVDTRLTAPLSIRVRMR